MNLNGDVDNHLERNKQGDKVTGDLSIRLLYIKISFFIGKEKTIVSRSRKRGKTIKSGSSGL